MSRGVEEVGKRKPNENPEALQTVRGVIVVGGRESRLHGEGLQAEGCVSSTNVTLVGHESSCEPHGESEKEKSTANPFCREPYAVKVARTVLTGGIKETCLRVTRLVPTHLECRLLHGHTTVSRAPAAGLRGGLWRGRSLCPPLAAGSRPASRAPPRAPTPARGG